MELWAGMTPASPSPVADGIHMTNRFGRNSSSSAIAMPKAPPIIMAMTDQSGRFSTPLGQQFGDAQPGPGHGRGGELIGQQIRFRRFVGRIEGGRLHNNRIDRHANEHAP